MLFRSRKSLSDDGYNREFVRPTAIDEQEEAWLRRVLREHIRLTGSARAERLLRAMAPLPLVRLEPLHPPCSIAQTWDAVLARLDKREIGSPGLPDALRSEGLRASEQPMR